MGLTDIVIREATINDAELLRKIEASDGFKYPYKKTIQDYERFIEQGIVFYVAELGKTPVGYIARTDCDNYFNSADRLHLFAVDKQHQRTGIGLQLIAHFEQEATKRGKQCVVVNVYKNNPDAIKFYEKRGYERWFEIPYRYEGGISAVVMRKDLGPMFKERKDASLKK